VAWYKKWNYRTFAEGATYIRLGSNHVGQLAHVLVFYALREQLLPAECPQGKHQYLVDSSGGDFDVFCPTRATDL